MKEARKNLILSAQHREKYKNKTLGGKQVQCEIELYPAMSSILHHESVLDYKLTQNSLTTER
jgi:hypothetical protein